MISSYSHKIKYDPCFAFFRDLIVFSLSWKKKKQLRVFHKQRTKNQTKDKNEIKIKYKGYKTIKKKTEKGKTPRWIYMFKSIKNTPVEVRIEKVRLQW